MTETETQKPVHHFLNFAGHCVRAALILGGDIGLTILTLAPGQRIRISPEIGFALTPDNTLPIAVIAVLANLYFIHEFIAAKNEFAQL